MTFSFKVIIASRGYHIYRETSWSNAKLNDEVKAELETDDKSLQSTQTRVQSKQGIPNLSVEKQWDMIYEKSLAKFILILC